MPSLYFETECNAPACEERFSDIDPEALSSKVEKHMMESHPERYHTQMDLPMSRAIRVEPELLQRMFPRSYSKAFRKSIR